MTTPPEQTPANAHLQHALEGVASVAAPLDGYRLTDWYVITVHENDGGETILSRWTRHGQPPWTDAGLLAFAAQEDQREWTEDDAE